MPEWAEPTLDRMRGGTRKHRRRDAPTYKTEWCEPDMSFQECELAILRHAIDETETRKGEKIVNSPEVRKIIQIVEDFLFDKKRICYGGTAINNILPKTAQFYDRNIEIPDYDFFSPTALQDAKELADIYFHAGYTEVEAKAGMHEGTYKVFVNFLPVADITHLHPSLYHALYKESIVLTGIRYAPANYLRMGMFLELSRPEGDVSRWEKVLKRMNLLNEYYPLKSDIAKCGAVEFQRSASSANIDPEKIYFLVRDSFIDQGVVFFGGYAASLYSRYMPKKMRRIVQKIPDFDVLSENPTKCAEIVKDTLREKGVKHVRLVQHTALGEVVPEHIEVVVGKETIAFIYRPISCHSYNTITVDKREVKVASIDTMLSLYLAFLYADKPYYDKTRILCMSAFLFQVEQQNRLEQKGLLKRFSIQCYGKQETLEDMRTHKNREFKRLSKNKQSAEYETAFLRYVPAENPALRRRTAKTTVSTRKTTHVPAQKTHVIPPKSTATPTEDKPNTPEIAEEKIERENETPAKSRKQTDSTKPRGKKTDPTRRRIPIGVRISRKREGFLV